MYCDPVLSVEFSKSGIHFIPLVDTTWYGAFFEVVRILYTWEEKKIEVEIQTKNEKEPDFDFFYRSTHEGLTPVLPSQNLDMNASANTWQDFYLPLIFPVF